MAVYMLAPSADITVTVLIYYNKMSLTVLSVLLLVTTSEVVENQQRDWSNITCDKHSNTDLNTLSSGMQPNTMYISFNKGTNLHYYLFKSCIYLHARWKLP